MKTAIKIYVDDVRIPDNDWIWIKTGEEFVADFRQYLDNVGYVITEVSLDHDLGQGWMDGTAIMKWFKKLVEETDFVPPKISFHSANPVGKKEMIALYGDIQRILENRG